MSKKGIGHELVTNWSRIGHELVTNWSRIY